MADIKQLQQEVQPLQDQERTSEVKVEAHQSEAARIICLIQPVQQKFQHIKQSLEEGPLEHISFDSVEQLATQAEELKTKVAKFQQIFKEFQDKVGPVAQPEPEA